jgi:hypothetical protein
VCELLYRAQSREGFKAKEHAAMEAIIARAAKWLVAVPKGEYFIEEAEARRLLRELLTVYEAYLKKPRTD